MSTDVIQPLDDQLFSRKQQQPTTRPFQLNKDYASIRSYCDHEAMWLELYVTESKYQNI